MSGTTFPAGVRWGDIWCAGPIWGQDSYCGHGNAALTSHPRFFTPSRCHAGLLYHACHIRLGRQHEACFITPTKLPRSWTVVSPTPLAVLGDLARIAAINHSGLAYLARPVRALLKFDYLSHASGQNVHSVGSIYYEMRVRPQRLYDSGSFSVRILLQRFSRRQQYLTAVRITSRTSIFSVNYKALLAHDSY